MNTLQKLTLLLSAGTFFAAHSVIVEHNGRPYELNERQDLEYQRLRRRAQQANDPNLVEPFFAGMQCMVNEEKVKALVDQWNTYEKPTHVLQVVKEIGANQDFETIIAFERWAKEQEKNALQTIGFEKGHFPLLEAVIANNIALVQALLRLGVAVDQVHSNSKFSSLAFAVGREFSEVVDMLLMAGAKVDGKGFFKACQYAPKAIVEKLIRAGANVQERIHWYGDRYETPLYNACIGGNIETVELLLAAGASFDDLEKDNTLLRVCDHSTHYRNGVQEFKNYAGIADLLIKAGARVDCIDFNRTTPLGYACSCGDVALARLLLQNGADINQEESGSRPFHRACSEGYLELMELLLQAGVDVNQLSVESGSIPLHRACATGQVEAVKRLLELGANKNQADHNGITPLLVAIFGKKIEVMRVMFSAGIDFDFVAQVMENPRQNRNRIPLKVLDCLRKWPAPGENGAQLIALVCDAYRQTMRRQHSEAQLGTALQCPICLEEIATAPIILHSALSADRTDVAGEKHYCCSICAYTLANNPGRFECPVCRMVLPRESIQEQCTLLETLQPELQIITNELAVFRNILNE